MQFPSSLRYQTEFGNEGRTTCLLAKRAEKKSPMITPDQIQILSNEIQKQYEAYVTNSMRVGASDNPEYKEGEANFSVSIDIEEATTVLCSLMEKVGEENSLSLEDFILFATICFHKCLGFPMEQSEALARRIISNS